MSIYGVTPSAGGDISKIEIEFAIPVKLTDEDRRILAEFAQRLAKAHEPEGWVHWQSGIGSKPLWSKADAVFLGKTADDNAPETGEPKWDESVLHIDTTAREAYPEEIERKNKNTK